MSQSYDTAGRLSSIAGMNGGTTLTSFAYRYTKGSTDTMLPQSYTETLMSPSGSATNVNGSMGYDTLNRLTSWQVTQQSGRPARAAAGAPSARSAAVPGGCRDRLR